MVTAYLNVQAIVILQFFWEKTGFAPTDEPAGVTVLSRRGYHAPIRDNPKK